MNGKKVTIIVISILILTYILVYLFTTVIVGRKMNSTTIIKKLEKNQELFEQVVEELEEYEEIYIRRDEDTVLIYKYIQESNNRVTKIEIHQEEFYKYEKSIKLLKEYKLDKIYKEHENTIFLFNSTLRCGQYIVKMNNEKKYRGGYIVLNMEKINDNSWYYIETKGL